MTKKEKNILKNFQEKNETQQDQNSIIIISKNFIEKKKRKKYSLIVKEGICCAFVEDNNKNNIIDYENIFEDDPDHSIEEAITNAYVNYLLEKNPSINYETEREIKRKIKAKLKECKNEAISNEIKIAARGSSQHPTRITVEQIEAFQKMKNKTKN